MIVPVKDLGKGSSAFMLLLLVCVACIIVFMYLYVGAYGGSHMMGEVVAIEGWSYNYDGETMTFYRRLDIEMPEATILIRANHQAVNVFLDGEPLFIRDVPPGENPGKAFHFITLPFDHYGRTLKFELTSPYTIYSGRIIPVLMGSHTALQMFSLSASMRVVMLMAMCLLVGLGIIALTFIQVSKGLKYPQNLAIGVFAVIWAFYIVSTDSIAVRFFSPVMASNLTLGLFISFQAPLSLFFYFSAERYKKWMLPAVILHCGFPLAAFILHFSDTVHFAELLVINRRFLEWLIYLVALVALDALKRDWPARLLAGIFAAAYLLMMHDFNTGLTWVDTDFYDFRYAFFVLIMCVLIQNIRVLVLKYSEAEREAQQAAALDRLNHMKSELITTITHETMTPLAVLSGYAELIAGELRSRGVDEQTAKDLDNIADETQRIAIMMDELHRQSRNRDNIRSRLNLTEMLEGAARMYTPILARKNIGLKLQISQLPDAYAGAADISQVLFNLLQNAHNHTETGEISIVAEAAGDFISVTVSDTGSGIPPELLPKIFERGVSGREHGSGLGLAICKEIINAHGGAIEINSDAQGTSVRFTLPLWGRG